MTFEPMETDLPVEGQDDSAAVDHDLELATLREAIQALPERCREVLTLRRRHGLSHAEVAERLGISKGTVNAQLTIAIVKCRAYFKQRGLVEDDR